MSTILDSLGSAFGPDVLNSLSKALGADPAAISKGLGVAGPLALAGMARMAGTPGGAESLLRMLPQDAGGGVLGNLGGLLSGLLGGGAATATGPVSALFGQGANAIGASLSRTLGFNVGPLLGLVVPAALAALAKLVKAQNLDASSLASLLGREHGQVADDPARRESAMLVASAMQVGDQAAAMVTAYGADWPKVVGGPVAALYAVSSSDLSGPIGSIKEAQAAGKVLVDAAGRSAPSSVLAAAFGSGLTPDMVKDFRALAPTKDRLVDLIKDGAAAVAARSPAEAQAYRATIVSVATATAEAAKEGGFLGIGGKLVSADEQAAIDAIKSALA